MSTLDVLELTDLDEEERDEWRFQFEDEIVFIGDTWEVTHDKFNTPMGPVYGIEIIADTVHTLLNGAPLRPGSVIVESLSMLLFLAALLGTQGHFIIHVDGGKGKVPLVNGEPTGFKARKLEHDDEIEVAGILMEYTVE